MERTRKVVSVERSPAAAKARIQKGRQPALHRRRRKPSFSEMMAMRGHFRAFKEARKFARSLKLGSYQEWLAYCRGALKGKKPKPLDIPQNPRDTYLEKGWAGFADWLGTGNVVYRFHSWRVFRKARAFVQRLKLPNTMAWRAYVRGDYPRLPALPRDIPTNPDRIYGKSGWKGFGDWLGNGNPSPVRGRTR